MLPLAANCLNAAGNPPTVSLRGSAEYTSQRAVPVVESAVEPTLLMNGPEPAFRRIASPWDAVALTLCAMVSPVAPDKETLAPDSAPGVMKAPPLDRVRLPVPVLMALAGSVRLPPATRLTD